MEFKAENKPRVAFLLDKRIEITFTTERANLSEFEAFGDKELLVKVQPYSKVRSLSQNAYMWVLMDELAKKLQITKEEVYKNFIKDYGVFEIIPIKNEAVERFIRLWGKKGIGWFVEDIGDSKLQGYTKLMAYYVSSAYNSIEMSRVINAVIDECEQQGINTMSLKDIMLLQNENDSL